MRRAQSAARRDLLCHCSCADGLLLPAAHACDFSELQRGADRARHADSLRGAGGFRIRRAYQQFLVEHHFHAHGQGAVWRLFPRQRATARHRHPGRSHLDARAKLQRDRIGRGGSGGVLRARTGREPGGGDLGAVHLARVPHGTGRDQQVSRADARRVHGRTDSDWGGDAVKAAIRISIKQIEFKGWANSWGVSNGEVELVVTGDGGPRVMRYGFAGGQDFFKECAGQMGKPGEADWQPRGGHRVWIAPEDPVKSYAPDNDPVAIEVRGGEITCSGPVEALTGMEKKITVKMAATGTAVELIHEVRNAGAEPYRLAPWILTMCAQGGAGIHGFPPRGTHPEILEPTNPLVMWAFTHLDDPRWRLSRKYLVLRQDPNNTNPQKMGAYNWT